VNFGGNAYLLPVSNKCLDKRTCTRIKDKEVFYGRRFLKPFGAESVAKGLLNANA
jgi:hypothetical protein